MLTWTPQRLGLALDARDALDAHEQRRISALNGAGERALAVVIIGSV